MGEQTKDRRLLYLVSCCIAYLALWFIVPYVGLLKHPFILFASTAIFLTALFMFVQISIPRWFSSLTVKPIWALVVLVLGVVLWIGIVLAVAAPYTRYDVNGVGYVPQRLKNPPPTITVPIQVTENRLDGKPGKTKTIKVTAVRKPSTVGFKLYVFNMAAGRVRPFTSLLMILAASAFGYLLSFILRNPNIILPVAGFAVYMDIWTVMAGPTGRALERAPHVVQAVSAALPDPGGASAGFAPIAYIGPADFIFVAMFLGALTRLKMEPNRTFWILFPALTIGMLAVLTGLPIPGLPALVLIGPVSIIANRKHFKLKQDEWIAIAVVGALLTIVTLALTQLMRR